MNRPTYRLIQPRPFEIREPAGISRDRRVCCEFKITLFNHSLSITNA